MSYYDQYKNATFAQDYQTPDWYRQNFGIGIDGNGASMDAYFATHPAEAADFQRITSGQTSQMSTNGSTLLKTPFANMSQDAQGYYSQNPNAQLAAEGFGMDPTLAYMNYTQGPGSIGIKDPKTQIRQATCGITAGRQTEFRGTTIQPCMPRCLSVAVVEYRGQTPTAPAHCR